MGSPFKMKPKTPMMKALVGKQGNLPQHLQDKIKAAPESPAKSYGSKTKSPMMKVGKPTDKSRSSVGRGGKDVVLSEKDEIVNKRDAFNKGRKTDFEQVTQTVEKGSKAQRGTTLSYRQGAGRIGTKTYRRLKGQKGAYTMVGSTVGGASGTRTLPDGTKVLKEATVSRVKKKGLASAKPKAAKLTRRALGLKEKTVNAIKPRKSTAGKPSVSTEELKNLKKKTTSPVKKYGSKKSPVMQQKLKKKNTKGNDGSFGKPGSGMQAIAGQRKFKVGGTTIKANVGKTRGATDLAVEIPKAYNRAKKYLKGKLGIPKMENNSPVKKRGVKALEAQRGTKNPSPLKKEHLKKKDTKGKTKLPKLVVNTPKGPKAPRGPQSGKIAGVRVSIQTKGRSTKNTDLLPYLKGRGKGSGARARKRNQR